VGIATGALAVAAISATSLGVLLAASATAFNVLKFIGAGYPIYLGSRLWRAPPFRFAERLTHEAGFGRHFLEGLSLQVTNPKAIFFFLSVFPQFIDPAKSFPVQFTSLVLTYSALVVIIHSIYALFAQRARGWLISERGGRAVNKAAATTFVLFGAALAVARR
jgi:homoserine/homoserine lactone efflux protein